MRKALRVLSMAGIVLGAELVAGVALGIGMRLAMRVVALSDGTPGTVFTPAGTLGILAIVTVLLYPVAALFLAVRRFFSGSPVRRGAMFGLWLVVPGLALPAREAFQIGFVPLNVVMFGSLFVMYGVVLSVALNMLERLVRRPGAVRASFPRPAPPMPETRRGETWTSRAST
jgi:hypothetical protein